MNKTNTLPCLRTLLFNNEDDNSHDPHQTTYFVAQRSLALLLISYRVFIAVIIVILMLSINQQNNFLIGKGLQTVM